MADNFDLRKYLVENKVTTNSRMLNEQFKPTRNKGFNNFAKKVADIIWSAGLEDPFAAELTDWDALFELWNEQGDLFKYTQSDIEEMANEAGVSQEDLDYILDLPQVSDLEKGVTESKKTKPTTNSKMLKEEEPGRAPRGDSGRQRGKEGGLHKYFVVQEEDWGEDAHIGSVEVVSSNLGLVELCGKYKQILSDELGKKYEVEIEILEGKHGEEVGLVHTDYEQKCFIFKYDKALEGPIKNSSWMSNIADLLGVEY